VRLLLPRSGYAPQQKSGPQEVGITAEGDNDALGGLFLAGWSVLHALARTPPAPRSQVGRRMLGRVSLDVEIGQPRVTRMQPRPITRPEPYLSAIAPATGCVIPT
jgi:hypothetical protein